MEKSYRIKANVGKDQVLNVNLKRDVDLYEVLSLKLSQEKLYKVHSSDYGVIVGRVLANDAFGIPNAKVSVFIPITDADKLRSDIKALYPYAFVNSYNSKNVRFNTLPEYKTNKCHKPVGDFPSKRLILDEDLELEVYDKYYKFTTVTNHAGDYMIFGVPVGEQVVHVDLDLSDIGVLSQRPTDFIYKGYDENLFESPAEFKTSTNLNELPQIISEDVSVNVYPFWGDKEENEIAITRKDVNVQYKFEPTCVFLGSVVADSSVNSIDHNCNPGSKMGEASQLTPSEGTIEMIRKTVDDRVEEYMIKGNKLIDGDGVFCYQIPMNLDFVCTDEYGNIVPTDNPTKGIPTRTRVRFRFTLNETENEALSSHKARYLVPNNPTLLQRSNITEPYIDKDYLDTEKNNNNYYEFGTLTNDECFRDLLWNKVYSVKNYIPRVQKVNSQDGRTFFGNASYADGEKNEQYLAIKGVNKKGTHGMNPLPFNKLNLNFSIPTYHILRKMWDDIVNNSWEDFYENGRSYLNNESPIRRVWNFLNGRQIDFNMDAACERAIEDSDGLGLDFYNDWLNGCLYFPNWYWYLAPGERNNSKDNKYVSEFCDCDEILVDENATDENEIRRDSLCVFNNCSLPYKNKELSFDDGYYEDFPPKSEKYVKESRTYVKDSDFIFPNAFQKYNLGSRNFVGGIIKKKTNKDNAILYYYSFGQRRYTLKRVTIDEDYDGAYGYKPFVRLFSTDIILLGSLDDNDIHGIPKISMNYPSTTSNIPPMGRYKPQTESDGSEFSDNTSGDTEPKVNGMNWGQFWFKNNLEPRIPTNTSPSAYSGKLFHTGLFFGLSPVYMHWGIFRLKGLMPFTLVKSCVNAERICELGVTNDSRFFIELNKKREDRVYRVNSDMDGMITKRELLDVDTRALFATLNSSKLLGEIISDNTGYKTYKLSYMYPSNFDGRLEAFAPEYTAYHRPGDSSTKDVRSKDYLDFRFGILNQINGVRHFYAEPKKNYDWFYGSETPRVEYAFPLYENSFYFYFGMNAEHTAIGEFYKKFIRKCDIEDKKPFNVEIDVEPATYCANNDGKIYVTVSEAALPYTIYLYKNGIEVETWSGDYSAKTFSELSNGDYEVVVEDKRGETISKLAKLVQDKIRLNFKTGVMTEACSCDSFKFEGIKISTGNESQTQTQSNEVSKPLTFIKLYSYINNGITHNITGIQQTDITCENSKIKVAIDTGIELVIELIGDNKLCEARCFVEDGNKVYIEEKFGNYHLTIHQTNCPLINKNNYWASTKI